MAQDIKELLKANNKQVGDKMPKGHEARFLEKLKKELPANQKSSWSWMRMAASIVVIFGLGIGAFKYFEQPQAIQIVDTQTDIETEEIIEEAPTKTLGDISPDFKKLEDYYLANINLELSKVTMTAENKELIDSYIKQLEVLNKEYKRISVEFTNSGPNELTVNALITNLKFRLNLMYRLKEQLQTLQTTDSITNRTNI